MYCFSLCVLGPLNFFLITCVSTGLGRAPAPEALRRAAANQMAPPVAAESPSRALGPASPHFQRLADSFLLHMCSRFGFSWYHNSHKLSSFIVSYKISTHTGQAGNWTPAEGHGERSLLHRRAFRHLVASTLFHPAPTFTPSMSSKLPMPARGHPALQGIYVPCPFPCSGSFSLKQQTCPNAHTPHTPGMVSFYLHSII